ncbi:MAG: Asp23/Gls24 family envelope stress response protein [Clostridiales Family XIII bacterium]|nr:Asp23/Gls24 family envelope stress response protein [Clostridiales Family XIII bacterium]
MLYKKITEYGSISFDKAIVAKIVRNIVSAHEKRVFFSDAKGRLHRNLMKEMSEDTSFLEANYREEDNTLDLCLYFILRFGTSIRGTAEVLTEAIRRDIPSIIGCRVDRVDIVITGVLSRKLLKNRTEVTTYADK